METQTYIECERNTSGNVLFVYTRPPYSDGEPSLVDEIVLPNSTDEVTSVATNGKYVVVSFANHGTETESGAGAVLVYKLRNDKQYHLKNLK